MTAIFLKPFPAILVIVFNNNCEQNNITGVIIFYHVIIRLSVI